MNRYHTLLSDTFIDDCVLIAKNAPDVWKKEDFKTILKRKDQSCFITLQDNQCVAFAVFSLVDTGFSLQSILEMLVVHPHYRHTGIASALLNHALENLKAQSISECILEVRISNTKAQALYEKCGFKCVAKRPNMYKKPLEDGLLMRKFLTENKDKTDENIGN